MATITLPEGIVTERCDKILAQLLQLPRAHIRYAYESFPFECNGKPIHLHNKVSSGDVITFEPVERPKKNITKKIFTLNVIFEDDDIMVINKPAGITVHPAPGVREKTLVEYADEYCKQLEKIERSGIVHRLDKDTTGVMILAKSERASRHLRTDFANHCIQKQYTCIVHGNPPLNTGKIEIPIARQNTDKAKMIACPSGKSAKTTWIVQERFQNFSWLNVKIYTGRTHQIRVHMSYIGHPIIGDATYGKSPEASKVAPRTMLHAVSIAFLHPRTSEKLHFSAPIPQDFADILENLRSHKS
ncbi:MAG: RluA family pseudouridine synthase [Puniceicoccales bacterium]|jgi:23S rRNA pseudouridine1911/1915/1917 synthase|nr:RluA family pseudouridine synthase [Puniceicoccales bacterium]